MTTRHSPGAVGHVQKDRWPPAQPLLRESHCRPGAADAGRHAHQPRSPWKRPGGGPAETQRPGGRQPAGPCPPRRPLGPTDAVFSGDGKSRHVKEGPSWRRASEQGSVRASAPRGHPPVSLSPWRCHASPHLGGLRLAGAGGSGAGEEGTEGSVRPHWTPLTPGPAGLLTAAPGLTSEALLSAARGRSTRPPRPGAPWRPAGPPASRAGHS